jgi:hypothetical protein
MEAGVFTLNVETELDNDGNITVAVENKTVFHGNMVEAVAACGAIEEVLAAGGFTGFSQDHDPGASLNAVGPRER